MTRHMIYDTAHINKKKVLKILFLAIVHGKIGQNHVKFMDRILIRVVQETYLP